jgi:hypothetical protein
MALCLTPYTAFVIQTPVNGSWFSEDWSPVYIILYSTNSGLTVFHHKLIFPQLLKGIFSLLRNYKIHYRVDNRPSLVPLHNQTNQINTLAPHFLQVDFNTALPSMPVFPKWSRGFRIPYHNFIRVSNFSLHTTYHTHHILLDFIALMFGKQKPTSCNGPH